MKTMNELLSSYEEYVSTNPKGTRENRIRVIRAFQEFLAITKQHPSEIQTQDLHRYLRTFQNANYSPYTIRQHFALLKSFYVFLYENHELSQHPDMLFTREFKRKLPKLPEPDILVFSLEDWARMWGAVPRERAAFLYLLYYTGARIASFLKLQLEDFDREKGILRIKESKTAIRNTIALSKKGVEVLDEYIREFRPRDVAHDFIFCSRKGSRWDVRSAQRWLKRFTKSTLGKAYPPKSFRASLITHFYDSGASDSEIVAYTGHKSRNTLRHYKKLSIATQRKIIQKHHPLAQQDAFEEALTEEINEISEGFTDLEKRIQGLRNRVKRQ